MLKISVIKPSQVTLLKLGKNIRHITNIKFLAILIKYIHITYDLTYIII